MQTSSNASSRSSGRQCWICFATEEDDPNQSWTKPCKCKGTTKWVHQRCLLMWIDLKTKTLKSGKILCPQCKMEYSVFYPPSNFLVSLLDRLDVAMFRVCPFLAGAIVVVLIYWSAITYGTVAMIQVLGPVAARELVESTPPAVVLLALPTIPVLLIGFNIFQWEDRLLLCMRKYGPRIPILKHILPAPVSNTLGPLSIPQVKEEMTCTRIIVTSLLTPGLATLIGAFLFKKTVDSPIKRAFLGFLVMNMVHGVIGMYHKQMVYKKYKGRRVLDYTPSNDAPALQVVHPETVP